MDGASFSPGVLCFDWGALLYLLCINFSLRGGADPTQPLLGPHWGRVEASAAPTVSPGAAQPPSVLFLLV